MLLALGPPPQVLSVSSHILTPRPQASATTAFYWDMSKTCSAKGMLMGGGVPRLCPDLLSDRREEGST